LLLTAKSLGPESRFLGNGDGRIPMILAARKTCSSTPRPEQQSANLPSITTEGTERMPRDLAQNHLPLLGWPR
jgi:hypothetical protein